MAKRQHKPITLTTNQVRALERAWEVLHYGYVADVHNGYDPAKRNHKRDQAAAAQIDAALKAAGSVFGDAE